MSEEINPNKSELCASEKDFDEFQSASMYEEEEYITLSDIVSPTPATSGLMDELPFDNDVDLDSTLDSQISAENPQVQPEEELKNDGDNIIIKDEFQNKVSQKSSKKRGRKKKNIQTETLVSQTYQSSEAIPSHETSLIKPAKKRGRKKKSIIQPDISDSQMCESSEPVSNFHNLGLDETSLEKTSELSEDVSACASRLTRKRIPKTPYSPERFDEQTTSVKNLKKTTPRESKRRGKKKKLSNDNEQLCSLVSESEINNEVKNKIPEKELNETEPDQFDNSEPTKQLPEVEYEASVVTSKDIVDEVLSNVSTLEKKPKKMCKRKSGKRKCEQKLSEPNINTVSNNSKLFDSDDGSDNISLIKLKNIKNSLEHNLIDNAVDVDIIDCRVDNPEHHLTDDKIFSPKVEPQALDNPVAPVVSDTIEDFDSMIKSEVITAASNGHNNFEKSEDNQDNDISLIEERQSKRPVRRKAKRNIIYHQDESDDDPFANLGSSEDDEPRRKKGTRYYSDDDWMIPGKKGKNNTVEVSESYSDEDSMDMIIEDERPRRKISTKTKRKSKNEALNTSQSPKVTTIAPAESTDDIENCLQSSVIKANTSKPSTWGANEFENFLAKKINADLKIKKVSSSEPANTAKAPLEIPVIDPTQSKKYEEIGTQTESKPLVSVSTQTSSKNEIHMKHNIALTKVQSEKACEFLKNFVQTTAELGQLMTEKSQDFIKKKINEENVTDTFKMDYCVKKSYLLFKLAKSNLMQMEEDLTKQYEQFLNDNSLSSYRELEKTIDPKPKENNGDSDCEIVDVEPVTNINKDSKSKFNPKTVFLNKELSIKIAKKPSEDKATNIKKNLNIKGKHTVWINDSIMVKKVNPTQSFLAQDSRNKKPPDSILSSIVTNFFKQYNSHQAAKICAPYISLDWISTRHTYTCNYFFIKTDENPYSDIIETTSNLSTESLQSSKFQQKTVFMPKTLFSLCSEILQFHINGQTKLSNQQVNNKVIQKPRPSLSQLCLKVINSYPCDTAPESYTLNIVDKPSLEKVPTLKSITLTNINKTLFPCNHDTYSVSNEVDMNPIVLRKIDGNPIIFRETRGNPIIFREIDENRNEKSVIEIRLGRVKKRKLKYKVGSLFSICVFAVQQLLQRSKESTSIELIHEDYEPLSLKYLSFIKITQCMYSQPVHTAVKSKEITQNNYSEQIEDMRINCVNTLTEDAFVNIHSLTTEENSHLYLENDNTMSSTGTFDNDETDYPEFVEEQIENDWTQDTHIQESKPCINNLSMISQIQNNDHTQFCTEIVSKENDMDNAMIVTHIKVEPLDEILEPPVSPRPSDSSLIKSEPGINQMTIIPESVITKQEIQDSDIPPVIERQNSFDVETFESFVRSSKLFNADECNPQNDEIFSQSGLRVHRQHEPDYDNENDNNFGLLIPHASQPFNVTKDILMKSSSDEESEKNSNQKKKTDKKRPGRPKKSTNKEGTTQKDKLPQQPTIINKEPNLDSDKRKDKAPSDLAVMTKKMKEKIRQEEKKIDSSESENESLPLTLRAERANKKTNIGKQKSLSKPSDDEIQCNNIDSTENEAILNDAFSGFSAIDQCEMSSYQKYVNFMYDKILHKEPSLSSKKLNDNEASVVNEDEPVEYLECEPTMPFMDNQGTEKKYAKQENNIKKGKKAVVKEKLQEIKPDNDVERAKEPKLPYEIRDGWNCYPTEENDMKLYGEAYVPLEKLPETFVETYFQFQEVIHRTNDDLEIDKLTNLSSLKRTIKEKWKMVIKPKKSEPRSEVVSGTVSPTFSDYQSDHQAELTPSEDEGENNENDSSSLHNIAPIVHQTENSLAKSCLMDDHESDSEVGQSKELKQDIKQEPITELEDIPTIRKRPGPKSRTRPQPVVDNTENLMLTADKVMQKDLALLHAPVKLDEHIPEIPKTGMATRPKTRNAACISRAKVKPDIKNEEDSSSEEEKQWVSTKEKLLKRIAKKPEDTSVEDAKRAKLVTEFIERRGGVAESHKHKRSRLPRRMRSRKKFLERQKQLNVLSRELYGENAVDPAHPLKRSAAYFKGRRNIRKVIDKKSLARSTVLANMREFERKRRISMKQSKLREVLGCEEDVNVLVINDEVCLEYDFEQNRPIVTIHSFFTKVMKAHQYEGVKFMWDACFESLEMIESGDPGGGCILAHCMGLGKTLQVLALLHTVLTHPRVGMQRVLVCCPLSTVLNWVDEIHKWIGPVTDQIKVFELSKLKKTYERAYQLEDWYNGGGIFIIGYELFRSLSTLDPLIDDIRPTIVNKIRTALLDPGPDIIVCDEGHLLKNDCSVLAVAMSRVATKRRIVLTGTPMQNNLREYYCMVNFIKPNLLGTYSEYSNRFENPIMNGQHRDSREEDIKLMKARTHILHKVLEGCLQRQEASVLYPYLPKKYEYTVFISLTKCQSDMYKHYLESQSETKNKNRVLRDFHVLQKIWTHPQVLHNFMMKPQRAEENKVKGEKIEDDLAHEDLTAKEDMKPVETPTWWLPYCDDGNVMDTLESSHKMHAVFKILEECSNIDDKVLIFSTSLYTMDTIEYFLKKIKNWSLGQEYYRLDGSVPVEVRQKWCREFNAENNHRTRLFLISTRAGCLGLNMVAANRVIIMDTSWNPAHDIQSIFRVYRFGQKKDCHIYRLVALGTMEQKIYERSVTKQAVACRVVDEQQIDRHYNSADLTELYKFDELGSTVEAGVASGVRDVVLLRVALSAAVHAVHEHDSLLRGSHTEQGLNETERDAAWNQFQQEHANKQVQNGISSSMSIHILSKQYADPGESTNESKLPAPPPQPEQPTPKNKGQGKKSTVKANPKANDTTENEEDKLEHNILVGKITNLLIGQKYHDLTNRKISEIVAMVRKIVTGNRLTQVSSNLDNVANSVALALFNQLSTRMQMPMLTDIAPPDQIPKRGRPRRSDTPWTLIAANSVENLSIPTGTTSQNVYPVSQMLGDLPKLRPNRFESIKPKQEADMPSPPKNEIFSGCPKTTFTKGKSKVKALKKSHQQDNISNSSIDRSINDAVTNASETESETEIQCFPVGKSTESSDEDRPLLQRIRKKKRKLLLESRQPRKKGLKERVESAPLTVSGYETRQKRLGEQFKASVLTVDEKVLEIEDEIETRNLSDGTDVILLSDKEEQRNVNNMANEVLTRKRGRPPKRKYGQPKDVSKYVNCPPKAKTNVEAKSNLNVSQSNEIIEITPTCTQGQKSIPKKSKEDVATPALVENESDPRIPLHPSLLRNDNFVKIVAHTYLTGNPHLSEDAATLAASYSVQKVLKDIESGVEVSSGPIYDIALKVLGKTVLSNLCKNDKGVTPSKPETRKPGPLSKRSSQQTPQSSCVVSVSITESQLDRQLENIVPVKLTKSVSHTNTALSSGGDVYESILPDDDEVVMTPAQPSGLPKRVTRPTLPASPAPVAVSVRRKLNQQSLLVNKVLTDDTLNKDKVKPEQSKIQVVKTSALCGPKVAMTTDSKKDIPKLTPQESILSDMICLDSDEEDAAPPGPVPISLMAATPAALAAIPTNTPLSFGTPTLLNTNPSYPSAPIGLPPLRPSFSSVGPGPSAQPQTTKSLLQVQPNTMPITVMHDIPGVGLIPQNLMQPTVVQQNLMQPTVIPLTVAQMQQLQQSGKKLIMIPPEKFQSMMGQQINPANMASLKEPNRTESDDIQVIEDDTPAPVIIKTPNVAKPVPSSNVTIKDLKQPAPSPKVPIRTLKSLAPSPKVPIKRLKTPAPPPSIPKIAPKPAPLDKSVPQTSKADTNKTVCKPGDILRITKDGNVEVLVRGNDIEEIIDVDLEESDKIAENPLQTKTTVQNTQVEEASKPAKEVSKPAKEVSQPPKEASKPAKEVSTPVKEVSKSKESFLSVEEPLKTYSRTEKDNSCQYSARQRSGRSLPMDSFSADSSSDESRSSSPSDPLSVLRNVVRIEAAFEGSTTPVKPTPQSSIQSAPKSSTDLLKDNSIKVIPSKNTNKITTPSASKSREVTVSQESMKVEGTTRTITISNSGKAKSLPFPSVDLTGTTAIKITKVQKIPATPKPSTSKSSEAKKRPNTVVIDAAPKKKPMTLKDFNLDDIDDIIELE